MPHAISFQIRLEPWICAGRSRLQRGACRGRLPSRQPGVRTRQAATAACIQAESERTFLLAGADRRIEQIPSSALNADGAICGISVVRAYVLSCMNATLGEPLRAMPADKASGKALWGRAGLSARGAVFIGMFEACRGGAAEAFLSR